MYRWIISGVLQFDGKVGPVMAESLQPLELLEQIAQAAYAAPAPTLQYMTHSIIGPSGLAFLGWYDRSITRHPLLMILNIEKRVVLVHKPVLAPGGWMAEQREHWYLEGEIERFHRESGIAEMGEAGDELCLGLEGSESNPPPAPGLFPGSGYIDKLGKIREEGSKGGGS